MTTRTEEVRRYSFTGEVTEVTGNQYAKRHTARATEGRDLGYFASITGTLSLCVQCREYEGSRTPKPLGGPASSVAWARGRYYLDECCEVWEAKEGERVA
jgi:hypothetical protein